MCQKFTNELKKKTWNSSMNDNLELVELNVFGEFQSMLYDLVLELLGIILWTKCIAEILQCILIDFTKTRLIVELSLSQVSPTLLSLFLQLVLPQLSLIKKSEELLMELEKFYEICFKQSQTELGKVISKLNIIG